MSIKIMTRVFDQSKTRNVARLILLSLADNANDNGACWPSKEEIARKAGVSIPTAKLYLKIFSEIGLVVKEARANHDGLQTSNMYYIIIDRIGNDHIDPALIRQMKQPSRRKDNISRRGNGIIPPEGNAVIPPEGNAVIPPEGNAVIPRVGNAVTHEPSVNHQDRNRQGSEDAAKPRAPARPPAKPSDDEAKHPAIQSVRQVTNRYPHRTLFASIITALGESPDLDLMRACFTEWVARGFNANSFKWLEWYTAGAIPPQAYKAGQGKKETVTESLARMAQEFERNGE